MTAPTSKLTGQLSLIDTEPAGSKKSGTKRGPLTTTDAEASTVGTKILIDPANVQPCKQLSVFDPKAIANLPWDEGKEEKMISGNNKIASSKVHHLEHGCRLTLSPTSRLYIMRNPVATIKEENGEFTILRMEKINDLNKV